MSAVNTANGHQMRGNCGKACNQHALHWLVDPIKTYNRQKVQILSLYPISTCAVANATWRPTVLSRMRSTCFLIGAPLQPGRMRLTQPRGFRGLQYWVWLFRVAFCSFYLKIYFQCIVFKRTWFINRQPNLWEKYSFLLRSINAREPVTLQLYAEKVVFTQLEK